MSTTEQIYALLVAANPVPEWDSQSGAAAETKPHLRVVAPGTKATQSQVHEQEPSTEAPRRRRLIPSLAVAVVIALIATAAIILFSGDPNVDSRLFVGPTPLTTTTAAPTPADKQGPATNIAEAGLPTEWRPTLRTQLTEVEGAVHLDSSIRLDSEQLSATGTASQVAQAVEMVQGVVVECAGTTYDEEFLWSATPQGTGELDFGDLGSVTIEFDAVLVTSSNLAGRVTGPFAPRVCGEWSGTYAGASGDLADTSGTFTVFFSMSSRAIGPVWTFDS